MEHSAFQVFVRVRPPTTKEVQIKANRRVLKVQDACIWLADKRRELSFAFQGVFQESSATPEVYSNTLAPLVESTWDGFNATCFAYGMTGAGKTHTMFGDMYLETALQPGLVSLALADLLGRVTRGTCQVKLSYLEIYNERISDLLTTDSQKGPLQVLDDPVKGVQVQSLREVPISSLEQVHELVTFGNEHRARAATGANQFSTRSHALLTITLERRTKVSGVTEEVSNSKLSLIDLAGSERAAVSENRGARMVEGANINRSLLALGSCINILSDPKQQGRYIPYRDSKLTRLLKESLGGNTRTVMIACISPMASAIEETVHTLSYADRARRIEKKVIRNVQEVERHVSEYKEIIVSLQKEIENLRAQLQSREKVVSGQQEITSEVPSLRSLEGNEALSKELLDNFEEHWELKQNITDIDSLNTQNKANIKKLLIELEGVKSAGNKDKIAKIKAEIVDLHQNIRENEESRNELLQSLYVRIT